MLPGEDRADSEQGWSADGEVVVEMAAVPDRFSAGLAKAEACWLK